MTFKEQMEKEAEIRFPQPNAHSHSFGYKALREIRVEGSKAALSSDLVKGLVDAGEKSLLAINEVFRFTSIKSPTYELLREAQSLISSALTNYKQEVKQ